MPPRREIRAAGAVVFRRGGEVLLVHRPKYDDWSFPKGKLDPGEHATAAAVREVAEETGLRIRLCRPLAPQRYEVRGAPKTVDYWVGRVLGVDGVDRYAPNDEIDRVDWVPVAEAHDRLSYAYDRRTLQEAHRARKRTTVLIVLRHAEARDRAGWRGEDRRRPLLATGRRQAVGLAAVLEAYDVRTVLSSPSARCADTVAPYVSDSGRPLTPVPLLSEEDAEPAGVEALAGSLLDDLGHLGASVVCTHRPVLPAIFAGLDLDDPALAKGEMLIAHVRRGKVVATERHRVR